MSSVHVSVSDLNSGDLDVAKVTEEFCNRLLRLEAQIGKQKSTNHSEPQTSEDDIARLQALVFSLGSNGFQTALASAEATAHRAAHDPPAAQEVSQGYVVGTARKPMSMYDEQMWAMCSEFVSLRGWCIRHPARRVSFSATVGFNVTTAIRVVL